MEQNNKFPKIPENYVHYPIKYYRNIPRWLQNPQQPSRPAENRFPRQQNVLRGVPSNIPESDELTNTFFNSVHQFESMKNNFEASHPQRQEITHRQANHQNFHQNRQSYGPSSNQRFQNSQTGHFESTTQNFTHQSANMDQNLRFRMPNPAFLNHQMHQRFNLPHCPPNLIPPLYPPMRPPPLPPLPQFQGQGQMFLNDSNYSGKSRIPLQNRPMGQDNAQLTSERYTQYTSRTNESINKCQWLEDIDDVQSHSSVNCVISVNHSSIGYSDSHDPNFIQSQEPYECPPRRFADPRYLTDCVERSINTRLTDTVNGIMPQNSTLKTKSPCEKYERQMKISMLGNCKNLLDKNDNCEMQTNFQNLNLSDSKTEKWSFDSPMKLSVKRVPSLVSRNNVSMDTGKENMPRVVLKRLCKSTVKKHSKYMLFTSPNSASTRSDFKLLNQDKKSISESKLFIQKNKIRKFELAKLESKQLNPLWFSPIFSENEKSNEKRSGNESQLDSSLKTSGRSRPMVKSRKCNRNLFDTIPNQQVSSSKTLDNSLEKSLKSTQLRASKYSTPTNVSAVELVGSGLDSSLKDFHENQQTKTGNTRMYDPCVITMPTDSRNSDPSNFHDNTVIYSLKGFNDEQQSSSSEEFEDNIGTSDHDGASVAGESTDSDANSDEGSHCSSNLSQYSAVYDDFQKIQEKAIKETKNLKKIKNCKQIFNFMSSKKKWHLRSSTYPLFSPAKKTLAEKAEFKNRSRHSRGESERISLAPCKIVIEDLKQMKNRFSMIQQKSKTKNLGGSDGNIKDENLKSNTGPIHVKPRSKPACHRNNSSSSTCSAASKTSSRSASACFDAEPSSRNRHSSESSTSTTLSQVTKNFKSKKNMVYYFDGATSKLVKVNISSKPRQPKILNRSCLQSLKQKVTSHVPTKDLMALSPRSLNTRPRSIKSPLTNKKLSLNVWENNESSVRKLRPGGLGIEWAEVQSGSTFGSVIKKAPKSDSMTESSEAMPDFKRTSTYLRSLEESSVARLDPKRTSLTNFRSLEDSSRAKPDFKRTSTLRSLEESSGARLDTKRTSLTDLRSLEDSSGAKLDPKRTFLSDYRSTIAYRRNKGLIEEEDKARSTVLCPASDNRKQLDGIQPSISTFEEQAASSKSSNSLEKYQESSSHTSYPPDYFQPSDGCAIDIDITSDSDMHSRISSDSRRSKNTGSELTASQNKVGEDLESVKEKNRPERNYEQKISRPKNKHPVIPSSKLSANRLKSPMKTRLSNGIRRKKKFVGYRNGGDSPIIKKSKLSDPKHRLASPRKQSVSAVSAASPVKSDHHPKRGRPCKLKNLVNSGAQSLGHRATSVMIEDDGTVKNCPGNPEGRDKGFRVEIPRKRRCKEGDVSSGIPKIIANHDLMPDAANKMTCNNEPMPVRNETNGRKQHNVYDHDSKNQQALGSSPSNGHPRELPNRDAVKPNLNGSTCREMPDPNFRLKRNSKVCRKTTHRRPSESSTPEEFGNRNEEQSNETFSIVPTTDSSSDSPKAKKKRPEKDARRDYSGVTICKKTTSTLTKEPVDKPEVSHADYPTMSRQVGCQKHKKNKVEENRPKSMETKTCGKKIGSLKSQKKTINEDSQHHQSQSSKANLKTNSDQPKPRKKHRRVEKDTDSKIAASSEESSTRHYKKRSRSKADHVQTDKTHDTVQQQRIHKQSSDHKDKEGTMINQGSDQGAVQKEGSNHTKHRKPKLVITQGMKKCFWCKFCYAFRGALADLKVHVADKHPYRCQICKTVFNSGTEIEIHRKAHINKFYHCKLCQRDLRFFKGIIQRHERSAYHKQLVRVQKQILEVILNKHGSQSLDVNSTKLPDLSQFADLIRFPTAVSSTENTETASTEGQNSAITRFYFENEEIKNLLSKVEQSLKETNTKKTTEVVLPQMSSSILDQDQPIKIASVQPMVPSTSNQPITPTESSANQPIEFQSESCGLNFAEQTLKHGQFTSQSTEAIESRSVLNSSGYQFPESNNALTGPVYDSTQSNGLQSQSQNYSAPYSSDCFDFDLNFNDFAAAKSEKSSENVLNDILVASKKMTSSSDVPDDFLEFWSSNYYQNVDSFYDNIPMFGLSSNPTAVPVSVPQIFESTNQIPTSNLLHPMKVIPEKIPSETVSIADISHFNVRKEKNMPFAEKIFPYSSNCSTSSEFGSVSNFTQHYQTPIMSATLNNEKTINRPSATITSAEYPQKIVDKSSNTLQGEKSEALGFQNCPIDLESCKFTVESDICQDVCSQGQEHIADLEELDEDFQRTKILDRLLQPLISEVWYDFRTKHQKEVPSNSLGKQIEDSVQNSPFKNQHGSLVLSSVQLSNTATQSSQNIKKLSSTDTQSTQNIQQLSSTETQNSQNIQQLSSTDTQSSQNIQQLSNTETQISQNIQQLSNTYTQNSQNIQQLSSTDTQNSQNIQQLSNTDTQSTQNIQQLSNTDTQNSQNIQQLSNTDTQNSQNIQQLSNTETQISQNIQQLSSTETQISQNIQQLSNTETQISQNIQQLSNTETQISQNIKQLSSTENIQSSSAKTQDTEEHLHTPCGSQLIQGNGPQVDDHCVANSKPRSLIHKESENDIDQMFQDLNSLNVNSGAAERRYPVLEKTYVDSNQETDSNTLKDFNKIEINQNILSSDLNLNSKKITQHLTDTAQTSTETSQPSTGTAMEGFTEAEENAGEVTLDVEESSEDLEDHNDTLLNNISTLDDPDFSLTSFINAVLPEEPLSSAKLPMKSLLDISETDLKMAEAELSLDGNSLGTIADDEDARSNISVTGTISKTASLVNDIASPNPGGSNRFTASPSPEGSNRITPSPSPEGSSRFTVSPNPGGSNHITVSPSPGGSNHITASPSPEGSSRFTVSPNPGGSNHITVSPRPGGSNLITVSPSPGGSNHITASPSPEGSSRFTVSPNPGGSNRITVSPNPGGSNRITVSPSPGGSNRITASPSPEGSNHITVSPNPGGSNRITVSPNPGGSNHITASPKLGGSNRITVSPSPGGSNHITASPSPGGSNRITASPSPGGSNRITASPSPEGSNRIIASPSPGGSNRIIASPSPEGSNRITASPSPGRSNRIIASPSPGKSNRIIASPMTVLDLNKDKNMTVLDLNKDKNMTVLNPNKDNNMTVLDLNKDKNMTVMDLNNNTNLADGEPCKRQAFFLSLKLCQSTQNLSNTDSISTKSDTDTARIEDDDWNFRHLNIAKLQDKTEEVHEYHKDQQTPETENGLSVTDSNSMNLEMTKDLNGSENVSRTPKSKHSLSQSMSEAFPCLASVLMMPTQPEEVHVNHKNQQTPETENGLVGLSTENVLRTPKSKHSLSQSMSEVFPCLASALMVPTPPEAVHEQTPENVNGVIGLRVTDSPTENLSRTPKSKHSLSQSMSETFPWLASVLKMQSTPAKTSIGTRSSLDLSMHKNMRESSNQTLNSSANMSRQSIEPEVLALDMLASPCEKLRTNFHEKYLSSSESSQNANAHNYSGKKKT